MSLWPFCRNISKRSSCSRAFKRKAAIELLRLSSGGVAEPVDEDDGGTEPITFWGTVGEMGGEAPDATLPDVK